MRRFCLFIYLALKKMLVNLKGFQPSRVKQVLVYPVIRDSQKLADLENRLVWALPASSGIQVLFPVTGNLIKPQNLSGTYAFYQKVYPHDPGLFKLISKDDIKDHLSSDLILVHRATSLWGPRMIFRLDRTEIIDKSFYSFIEGFTLQTLLYKSLNAEEKLNYSRISEQNYTDFLNKHKNKSRAVCFLTGPSIDNYSDYNYPPEAVKIICNSNVKYEGLLNYIGGPDAIMFADPVFHFSPSEYAAKFREQLIEVVEKHRPYLFVPEEGVPLLLAYYPSLKSRLIGVKSSYKEFIFPESKPVVKQTENILTFLMIPVASAVADEIFIIGADGREQSEKYFWEFSKEAQFNDEMESVRKVHPSFFRDRNYGKYYKKHCSTLENLINFGESKGKSYYTLTSSYIPVLKDRLNLKFKS